MALLCTPDQDITVTNSKILLLQNMPVFFGLNKEALDVVLLNATVMTLPAGEFFFRQGDTAHYMYVIETGQCSVHKSWLGHRKEIGNLGPGDCFGEVALIESSPRSASVQATTACTAIEISPMNLQSLKGYDVEQYITVQTNISRELCRRLRLADENRMSAAEPGAQTAEGGLLWPTLS